MNNRGSTKTYVLLGIVLVLFSLVYGINHWLNQQIDEANDQSTNENSVASPVVMTQSTPTVPGIPVIDPVNDPLAPVSQKPATVKISTDPEGAKEKSAATVYEFPERNEIIPQ